MDSMERYEVTFLTRSEEEQAGVLDLLATMGAQMESQAAPLRRKLAYPIKKEASAVYYTYMFNLPKEKIAELNLKLNRNEQILRHLIIAGGLRKALETAPKKMKESDLAVAESLMKGTAEMEAAEAAKAKSMPAAEVAPVTETTTPTPAPEKVEEPASSEIDTEPKKGKVSKRADKSDVEAHELTADERQKKLEEKLKSILGN